MPKKTRELVLYGDVGWEITAQGVSDSLAEAGAVDELVIRLNSFGGEVFEGVAIYQRLKDYPARVTCHVDGIAASIASIIMMAADEVVISSAGYVMIHDAWSLAMGNAAELRAVAERLEGVSATIAKIYVSSTGQSTKTVREWMAEERWFDADEAVASRLVSKKKDEEPVMAKFNPDRHRLKKVPPVDLAGSRNAGAAMTVARMKMRLGHSSRKLPRPTSRA